MDWQAYKKTLGWRMRLRMWWACQPDILLARLGLCKHPGSLGSIGSNKGVCLYCGKAVREATDETE